jgi:hypothetical protein
LEEGGERRGRDSWEESFESREISLSRRMCAKAERKREEIREREVVGERERGDGRRNSPYRTPPGWGRSRLETSISSLPKLQSLLSPSPARQDPPLGPPRGSQIVICGWMDPIPQLGERGESGEWNDYGAEGRMKGGEGEEE